MLPDNKGIESSVEAQFALKYQELDAKFADRNLGNSARAIALRLRKIGNLYPHVFAGSGIANHSPGFVTRWGEIPD
ncbi:hypothetical protein [Oscillatoria sp. HE19RPO]|uniref:hypothetical protein n=1 Tax=Oscillatoria sp. HE19RPO TaxID=2954806 RepID=UPI0020C516FE|nr:hypothetical protein [Oscillatoria sp. HE19RPO]